MPERIASRRKPAARQDRGPAVGQDPEPGYYRTRLGGRGSPWVPARIYYGAPYDPETGEPLDRPHRLICLVAGESHDAHERWPMHPISREEFIRLLAAMPDDPRVPRALDEEEPLF